MTICTSDASPPGEGGFDIAFEQGVKRLLVLPFRMLRREGFDAAGPGLIAFGHLTGESGCISVSVVRCPWPLFFKP